MAARHKLVPYWAFVRRGRKSVLLHDGLAGLTMSFYVPALFASRREALQFKRYKPHLVDDDPALVRVMVQVPIYGGRKHRKEK